MPDEDLVGRLLYRDALMLIIDKPAGLSVHEGGQGGASLRTMLPALRFGLPRTPELAHRLDRDTSGCLVLGRHRRALARLGRLFAEGRVDKVYWALTVGAPAQAQGVIDRPLLKTGPGRMAVHRRGQPSQTSWRLLGSMGRIAWLELRPLTGRMHQIRVHLAHAGHPIVGDKIYGPSEQHYLTFIQTGWTAALESALLLRRHALHSAVLEIPDDALRWEAALAPDLQAFLSD